MLAKPWPAINTGVMAWTRNCMEFAGDWRTTTLKNVSFICDEIACQLIYPDHSCRVFDDRWNASPVYSRLDGNVKILHGHGRKFWTKEEGRRVWLPAYNMCLARDYAKIAKLPVPAKLAPYL
jgi:hypothetical protein